MILASGVFFTNITYLLQTIRFSSLVYYVMRHSFEIAKFRTVEIL